MSQLFHLTKELHGIFRQFLYVWKKITTVTYMSKIFEDSQNINMTSWPVQFAFNLLKLFHNILGLWSTFRHFTKHLMNFKITFGLQWLFHFTWKSLQSISALYKIDFDLLEIHLACSDSFSTVTVFYSTFKIFSKHSMNFSHSIYHVETVSLHLRTFRVELRTFQSILWSFEMTFGMSRLLCYI